MKIPWKGIGILIVLLFSIYYDYPTLMSLLPSDETAIAEKAQNRLQEIKSQLQQIKGIELALSDPDSNRIQLIVAEGFKFPLDNPVLKTILKDNFILQKGESGVYLVLKPDHDQDIFVSNVSEILNGLFTNVRKIKEIRLAADKESFIFSVKDGKRLSPNAEPIKTLLGGDYDFSYQDGFNQYISRLIQKANLLNLGLDLQGGMYQDIGVKTEVVLQTIMDDLASEIEDYLLEDTIDYKSVNRISETEVEIILEEGEQFSLTDEKYTRLLERDFEIIPSEGKILIRMIPENAEEIRQKSVNQALETIRNRIDLLGVKEPSIQKQGDDSIIIQLPGLKDPEQARRVIGQVAVLEFMKVAENGNVENPTKNQVVYYQEVRDPDTKEIIRSTPWVLEKKVLIKGERVRDARVGFMRTQAEAMVTMSFDEEGKDLFAEVTKKNVGKLLAIVLDGKVQSAPRINEAIEGGEAQITGNFTPEEASELALVLRSGSLPAPIVINEERSVGASLGNDSIRQAMISLIIGFASVIIFMIVYYSLSGVFAILALLFNLFLILAALVYFQATLTLPGMAGIILTIGMAVDANVLIFERIREEISQGSPIRAAINTGFSKATTTILDSNITTILAAIVLFQFGTGPIKGFSVTLSIGILASMFTSIVVGKYLFEIIYLQRSKLEKISI